MKKTLYIMAISICNYSYSQTNLVPNPSFESFTSCPTQDDEATKCQFWSSYRTSPDYFNSCNTFSNSFSTPYNIAGFQIPANGNSYMGLALYASPTQALANYREYLGAKLTSTLIINQKYFFSLKYVGTKNTWGPSNCYSSKLGVNFSKTSFSVSNPYPITNTAKVFENTIVNDTANWQTIKGSFIADSAYQYLIIGNFFDDSQTDTLIFDSGTNCTAYYFVDNVCLSTDSAFAYNYTPNAISKSYTNNSNFKIYPNPASKVINIDGDITNENYVIRDVFGTIVEEGIFYNKKNKISVIEMPNGMYFLEIKNIKTKVLINN